MQGQQQNPQFQMQQQNGNQYQQQQQNINQRQQQQLQQEQFMPSQSAIYPNQSQQQYQQQYQQQGNMSNSMVSFYDANGVRRHYPKNNQYQKSEWKALEQHKYEVDYEIKQNEQAIRDIKLKHLLSELDKKLLQDYERKKEQLIVKQLEAEEMMRQQQAYQEQLRKNNEDKKQIQKHLAQYYEQQQNQQVNRDNQYVNQKKEWEQKLIQHNQEIQRLEEEKKNHLKSYLWKENYQNLEIENQKRERERQEREKEKDEYNKLIQIQEERQHIKDENYKQFYSDLAQQQEQQYLMHYDSVMKPMLQRMEELERIINRDANEINQRRAQEELNMLMKKKKGYEDMNQWNINLMKQQQQQKDAIVQQKKENVQNRLQDVANYQEFLTHERLKKLEGQEKYKQWLDKQSEEVRQKFIDEQRMTRNEKGLNRLDLQSWKQSEQGMYSMIPGWSPQIGQLPPRQNREELSKQIMDSMRPQNQRASSGFNGNFIRPNITAQGNFGQNRLTNAASQSISNLSQLKEYQRIGEKDDYYQKSLQLQTLDNTIGREYRPGDIYRYKHNPITNPMPQNIQNPYIQKQYLSINSSQDPNQNYNNAHQQQQQQQQQQYSQNNNQYQNNNQPPSQQQQQPQNYQANPQDYQNQQQYQYNQNNNQYYPQQQQV